MIHILLHMAQKPMIGLIMNRIRKKSWSGIAPRVARSTRFLIVLVAIASATSPARAQRVAKTPLPEFTGRAVAVAEVPDNYPRVLKKIEQVEEATGVSFYVSVVRSSGRGENATRNYVDDLFRAWSKAPDGKSRKFDPERSVLIVVAVDNRQIATHAGPELRRRYGLDAATIRDDLVEKWFIPLAKEQKYEEAMIALMDGFQEKIAGTTPRPEAVPGHDRKIAESPAPAGGPKQAAPPAATSRTTGRQLVWALLASLVAVSAIVFGLLWLGRRRVNDTVSKQLKGVKGQAVEAMDRLDALKERHKLLPASAAGFTEPMTGRTLELYNAVKAKLDTLWDRWLAVMDKIDRAQKLLGAGGDFGLTNQKSRQAEDILKDVQFPEIEAEAKECSADLDRLEKAHDDVLAALRTLADAREKLRAKVESVGKSGLPTTPYQPELTAIEGLGSRADALVVADPIGSEGVVEEARAKVEGQIARAGDVLDLLTQSRTIERSLKEVERAVAVQRTKGLNLQEDGGNPDPTIVEGVRRHGLGLAALQSGEPDRARAELAEADNQAKKAQQVLDAVVQAKAACQRERPARDRETARLRDAFAEAKNYRDELQRDFAPASWEGVARNLDQAKALLDTFDRRSAEAAAEGSDTKQNYLLGARLFEELGRQQQIALRLMAGLGEQVNILAAIRKEAQDLRREVESSDRKVGGLFEQNGEVVSPQAQGLLGSARRAASGIAGKFDDRRPDWPAIRDELKQILEEYAIAETQAEAELNAYASFIDELDGVRREASRVETFLASHAEDRPAANRRFRSASSNLDRIASDRTSGREWPRLLQIVRDASKDLQAAERMAREDIRLAAQAESDIAEANGAIQQAGAANGMGIVANTSEAESLVGQARQLLGAQNYEQAIARAEAAFQSARSAYNEATQQIFYQQMQYEAQRRRQYASDMARASYRGPSAGSIAATSAAAAILGRMAEAANWQDHGSPIVHDPSVSASDLLPAQERSGGDPSDGGTTVSSWASESSQNDW